MEWQYNYGYFSDELCHWGIPGQKWGIRRFQNPDGTLTEAGRKRYRVTDTGDLVEKTKKERREDARQAKLEKKEQERQTRLEREHETERKKKARIAKSRDPELIYKNRKLFTANELNQLAMEINAEDNMARLMNNRQKQGKTFIDGMEKFSKGINAGAGIINAGANFVEATKKFGKLFEEDSAKEKAMKRAKKDAEYYKNWYNAESQKKNLQSLGVSVGDENFIYRDRSRTYPIKENKENKENNAPKLSDNTLKGVFSGAEINNKAVKEIKEKRKKKK